MLSSIFSVAVLAAAPTRGLRAASEVELITQVEARLATWLVGSGDREDVLASPSELRAHFVALGVNAADASAMLVDTQKQQHVLADLQAFSATRALVVSKGRDVSLNLFDAEGRRCELSLLMLGATQRVVVLSGPRTDARSVDAVLSDWRAAGRVVTKLFEKRDSGWTAVAVPAAPAPGCETTLTQAAQAVYRAEKSYFAEADRYSNDFERVGIDPQALGVRSVKVSLTATAETASFTAELALGEGVVTITERGELGFVSRCAGRGPAKERAPTSAR